MRSGVPKLRFRSCDTYTQHPSGLLHGQQDFGTELLRRWHSCCLRLMLVSTGENDVTICDNTALYFERTCTAKTQQGADKMRMTPTGSSPWDQERRQMPPAHADSRTTQQVGKLRGVSPEAVLAADLLSDISSTAVQSFDLRQHTCTFC
ncbi:uncharacterized protein RBU33_004474 [Hipposideros larvatus]